MAVSRPFTMIGHRTGDRAAVDGQAPTYAGPGATVVIINAVVNRVTVLSFQCFAFAPCRRGEGSQAVTVMKP
ncbi:hypothetical protein GCM10010172_67170 [Paractinoplanes ferrugineus]|uniref:Uncharacterized protein n=1 Tax=Paractinoplanes ferrugineus TaxID=113564 RepID=A0A919J4A4_9ACTN|nr:hypothetical protein Afe05nite_49620 [Actinoplanes ferrugineus]